MPKEGRTISPYSWRVDNLHPLRITHAFRGKVGPSSPGQLEGKFRGLFAGWVPERDSNGVIRPWCESAALGASSPGTIGSPLTSFMTDFYWLCPIVEWELRPGNSDNAVRRELHGSSLDQWRGVWRSTPSNPNGDRNLSIQISWNLVFVRRDEYQITTRVSLAPSEARPIARPPSTISDQCDSRNYLYFLSSVSFSRTR